MNKVRPLLASLLAALLALLVAPAVFAQDRADPAVDAARKRAIVAEVSRSFNDTYVFPEAAKKVEERLQLRLAKGDYDQFGTARAFARAVAADILEITKDHHTGFRFAPEEAADMRRMQGRDQEEIRRGRERQLAAARRENFAFRKVERLAGNVGYLDLRNFLPADIAGPTAVAALNFLANCDAVIVDLRQNGGGDPTMIQLITSYFFDEPAHLNDIWTRSTNRTEHFWTLPYVPGPRLATADLYVLTSARTFSAAEEFSYNLKNLKRATLVGETTGGGAHPTDAKVVQEDYVLRVPFARSINPVSKTNWEGTGVAPDIAVPAAQALDKAYESALTKVAGRTTDPRAKAEAEWVLAGLRARTNPPKVDDKVLASYAGVYQDRKITFENGALFYQRTAGKYRLVPITPALFGVEGLDDFRLEFVVREGRVVEVVGLMSDGERDPSPRTK